MAVPRRGTRNCWLEIVLDEGIIRQLHRLLAALGVKVLRLVRVAIGSLVLGGLAKGRIGILAWEKSGLSLSRRDRTRLPKEK